jgi:hypothetical protein
MTIETPERNPTAHLAIAGTGRAGTSFLVRYLTELGLDTHLARHGEKDSWDEHANAGLETVPLTSEGADLPYVVKYPWLHQCIDHILTSDSLRFDAVIIPVRELGEAAISRTLVELQAMHRTLPWMVEMDQSWEVWGNTPGGLTYSLNPLDQGRLLAVGFHQLIERLTRADIPIVLLAFPRLAEDPHYLFRKLRPLLPATVSEDAAGKAHARVSELAKVRVRGELAAAGSEPAAASRVTRAHDQVARYMSHDRLDAIAIRRELGRLRRLQCDAEAAAESARSEIAAAHQQRAHETTQLRERLVAATEQHDREVSELHERLAVATEQWDREVSQLRERLAVATEQHDREVSQLHERLAVATEQRDREVSQLHEQLAVATEQHDREASQLHEQHDREVSQLRKRLAVATEQRDREASQLHEQVIAAKADAARLGHDLQAVYSSRSWRLTGGYRALGRAMENVRKRRSQP